MEVSGIEQRGEFRRLNLEKPSERLQSTVNNKRTALARQSLSTFERRPACDDRLLLRHGRPPGRIPFIFRKKKTHIRQGFRLPGRNRKIIPEAPTEAERHSHYSSHLQVFQGLQLFAGQCRSESHRARIVCRSLQNPEWQRSQHARSSEFVRFVSFIRHYFDLIA